MDSLTAVEAIEVALVFSGVALAGAGFLSPAARERWRPAVLGPWRVRPSDFVLFLLLAIGGGLAAQMIAVGLLKRSGFGAMTQLVLIGASFQLGMLGGLAAFPLAARADGGPAGGARGTLARTGFATFLICLPVLFAVTVAWQGLLTALGLPVEKQDLVSLFANARSPILRGALVVLAAVVAPVTEELIFRAGLFRYLRTRIPRIPALLGPALLFGALHVDWKSLNGLAAFVPLVALGIVFSLAYERTGRIGTTMVAHSLFNLNTIMLMLAGFNV